VGKLRIMVALVALSLSAALIAACGSSSKKTTTTSSTASSLKKPIIIGGAIALTGGFSAYDLQNRIGSEVAVNDINAAGGVLGRPLKYVVEDTQSNLAVGPRVATDLLSKGAVAMIAQCDYDYGAPAALVANSHHIPVFSCASSPKFGVQGIGPYAFDVSPPSNEEGAGMAETAYNRLHARTAYMLTDTTLAYSADECASFKKAWAALPGTTLVGSNTFKNTDTSISAQVTQMASASPKPAVIIVCSYLPGGPNAIRQIRSAGINTPIISGSGMDSRGAYTAIPHLSNYYILTYGSIYGTDSRPAVNTLFQKYKALSGKPAVVAYPILAYTEVQLIAKAIQMAGSTSGPAMLNALNHFTNVQTLDGPVTYTPTKHYSYLPEGLIEYVNGNYKFLGLITPKSVPPPPL
jgi:branched-chain amino acid transport system substrate-binding protein